MCEAALSIALAAVCHGLALGRSARADSPMTQAELQKLFPGTFEAVVQ